MKIVVVPVIVSLAFGTAQGAFAEITLYDNGPVSLANGSWPIDGQSETSDSFTLSRPATVDAISFGSYIYPNTPITSLQWSIGTSFYDASLGTGDATVNSTTLGQSTNETFFTVDSDSFSLNSPVSLAAGTYYLTLQNATAGSSWSISNGPSSAQLNSPPTDNDVNVSSDSFQVLGSYDSVVPEPSGTIPLLIGAMATGLLMYRRRRVA